MIRVRTKTTGMTIVRRVKLKTTPTVRIEMSSYLKIELSIRVSGKDRSDMALVLKSGQMELSMKVIGKIIRLMVKVLSGMFMVTSMKVSGRETKLMGMASTRTVMVLPTKGTGKMISNTVRV